MEININIKTDQLRTDHCMFKVSSNYLNHIFTSSKLVRTDQVFNVYHKIMDIAKFEVGEAMRCYRNKLIEDDLKSEAGLEK